MQSHAQIRVLGGLLAFLGLFLLDVVNFIINFVNNAVNHRYSTTTRNASLEKTRMMLAVLYLYWLLVWRR